MDRKDGPRDGGRFVYPGDEVGSREEYTAGDGVYEEGGRLLASRIGRVSVDRNGLRVSVTPVTSTPVVLRNGDIAIGEVYELRKSMAVIDLWYKEGVERQISSDNSGTLYISKISQDYLEDMRDAFYIGDVIRARVIQAEPSVQLECADQDLGVIFSDCPMCNVPMDDMRDRAKCPQCGVVLRKKLSSKYRRIEL